MSQSEDNDQALFDLSVYQALYLTEARKCLVALQQSLAQLDENSNDRTALQDAHRAAHTLKGMSATMRYEVMVAVAETLEEPLRQADRNEQTLAPEQIKALLAQCEDFETGLDRLDAVEKDQDATS
jgi:two-component system chemotaxis sensor kinase CheA